jgi:hypothetical protein
MNPGLREAVAACRRSLAASPRRAPDPDAAEAVIAALGPYGRLLDAEETALAVAARPELAGMVLGAPLEVSFIAPAVLQRRRLERLVALDAPAAIVEQTRADLAAAEATPFLPPWERVVRWPDSARFPGNARRLSLALACLDRVLPWRGDDRALPLVDEARRVLAGLREGRWVAPTLGALRAEVEASTYDERAPIVPTLVLRAIVLAHDLATESDARVEQNEPHDLARWAIEQHEAPGDPEERAAEVAALNEAFFLWWLGEVERLG